MSHQQNGNYYQHIDGLRALAVLSVILTHLNFSMFGGGFVGVDVFFVISGFLITNIIMKELANTGQFSFLHFYARRIRRIIPALLFTLLVSLVISIWLLNLAKFKLFGGSFIAAALSVSNIFFYKQAGYFDIFSQSSPLLHTWSLGVEEQFYIFWPIILLSSFKLLKKSFFPIILFIFLLSFILNLIYQNKNSDALYYLVQFRAFEFCIGAFVLWILKYTPKKNSALEICCLLGVTFILYPIITYNQDMLFPTYNALLPTIGAALVIFAGKAKYVGYCFRNNIARFIGLISYSLYLIHWPIIVFAKTYNENIGLEFSISFLTKIAILLSSIIIATMMYYMIEQPFRKPSHQLHSQHKKLVIKGACAILLTTLLGLPIYYSKGWLWRANAPLAASKVTDISRYHMEHWGGSHYHNGGYIYHKDSSQAPDIVMLGDSHSGMLDEGMVKEIGKPYHLTIFTASTGGAGKYSLSTLPLPGITRLWDKNQALCDKSSKEPYTEAVEKVLESKRAVLILSANYQGKIITGGHLSSHKPFGINPMKMSEYRQYTPLTESLDKLTKQMKGHKLIIIGQTPHAKKYNVMQCITKLKWFHSNNCLAEEPRSTLSPAAININNILKTYASKHQNVYFIDPTSILCNKTTCINLDKNGTPMYSDGGHLSNTGSRFFIAHIKNKLLEIMESQKSDQA